MVNAGPAGQPGEPKKPGWTPPSPAARKALQKCFEHASKQITQENYDYATKLLTDCVQRDPSNRVYLQTFVETLQKKYKNNRKGAFGARFKEVGARGAIKKALKHEDWCAAITNGLEVLKVNPWDVKTLMSMATAAQHMGDEERDEQYSQKFHECELYYLKSAQNASPKDPEVNKQCAVALAERGLFDQAIACWHRVEQARPDDEEAQREIASLAVKKTIQQGGYEETDPAKKFRGAKPPPAPAPEQEELSEVEILQRKIARSPDELVNYLELAQLLLNNEDFQAAEKLYQQAFEISNGDAEVREKLMDVQVRCLRHEQVRAKEHRQDSPQAEQEYQRIRKERYAKELERCKYLCQRYPNNFKFKYDLGDYYRITRQYNDAIKEFQQAKNDPRCKGLCLLGLGQCFQAIKQSRLAMKHYAEAIEEIPDREAANKKEALYLAGKMALDELKDLDAADKHLTALAGLDFAYKDVSELLEKLTRLREGGEEPGEVES
jgi:tetratricopeptide (TPR) repeat protein